jgi:fucose permease
MRDPSVGEAARLRALFVLSVKFDHVGSTRRAGAEGMGLTFLDALRSPLVWAFAMTLGFMEVVEFGAANWGALHLQDVYQLDPRTAGASLVSAFYILFTLSRLFSGLAIEKIGYIRSLCLAAVCTIAVFLAGFGLGRSGIWILLSRSSVESGLMRIVHRSASMSLMSSPRVLDRDTPIR